MEKLFNKFMEEFRPWVLNGCQNHPVFKKNCDESENFASFTKLGRDAHEFCYFYFSRNDFPFNNGYYDYLSEKNNDTLYQNPKRLAFIQNWEPLK